MAPVSLSAALAEIKANPLKHYTYILHREDGSPFYVGVGSVDRVAAHEKAALRGKRGHKNAIIRKIIGSGGSVSYSLPKFFGTRDGAVEEECRLIAVIGRYDLGTGPLTNLTNGGDGAVGLIRSEEHRRKLGAGHKGKTISAETRKKLRLANLGKKQAPEVAAKVRAKLLGHPVSELTKEKLRAAMLRWAEKNPRPPKPAAQPKPPRIYKKTGPRPDHVKAKIAATNLGQKRSVEARANIGRAQRLRFERHRLEGGLKLPHHKGRTPEGRAKHRRPVEVDGIRFDGVDLAIAFLGIGETTFRRWVVVGRRGARLI